VIHLIANLFFFLSLRYSPMSRTVPYLSLTPVFTALAAIPILGEFPNRFEGGGILLVVLGAVMLNKGEGHLLKNLVQERGSVLMIGVASLWSIAGPFEKYALEFATLPFHALTVTSGITLGVLIWLALASRLNELKSFRVHYVLILAAMIAVTIGYVFQLMAISELMVSFVETFKRSVGCLMALVLGRSVFHEAVNRNQLLAVALMVAGVVLLFSGTDSPVADLSWALGEWHRA